MSLHHKPHKRPGQQQRISHHRVKPRLALTTKPHGLLHRPFHTTTPTQAEISAAEKSKLRKESQRGTLKLDLNKDFSNIKLDRYGAERLPPRPRPRREPPAPMDPLRHQRDLRIPLNDIVHRIKLVNIADLRRGGFTAGTAPDGINIRHAVPLDKTDYSRMNKNKNRVKPETTTTTTNSTTATTTAANTSTTTTDSQNKRSPHYQPDDLDVIIQTKPIVRFFALPDNTVYKRTGARLQVPGRSFEVKREQAKRILLNSTPKKEFVLPDTWTTHPYHHNYNTLTKRQHEANVLAKQQQDALEAAAISSASASSTTTQDDKPNDAPAQDSDASQSSEPTQGATTPEPTQDAATATTTITTSSADNTTDDTTKPHKQQEETKDQQEEPKETPQTEFHDLSHLINTSWDMTGHYRDDINRTAHLFKNFHKRQGLKINEITGEVSSFVDSSAHTTTTIITTRDHTTAMTTDSSTSDSKTPHGGRNKDHQHITMLHDKHHPDHHQKHHHHSTFWRDLTKSKPSHAGPRVEQIISPTFIAQQKQKLYELEEQTVSGQLRHTIDIEKARMQRIKQMFTDAFSGLREGLPQYDVRDPVIRERMKKDFEVWRKINLRFRDKNRPELGGISRWYIGLAFIFCFFAHVKHKHNLEFQAETEWANMWREKLVQRNVVPADVLEHVDHTRWSRQQAERDIYHTADHTQTDEALEVLKRQHGDADLQHTFDLKTHLNALDLPIIPTTLSGQVDKTVEVLPIKSPHSESFAMLPTKVVINPEEINNAFLRSRRGVEDIPAAVTPTTARGASTEEEESIDDLINTILQQQKEQEIKNQQIKADHYQQQQSSTSLLQTKSFSTISNTIPEGSKREEILAMFHGEEEDGEVEEVGKLTKTKPFSVDENQEINDAHHKMKLKHQQQQEHVVDDVIDMDMTENDDENNHDIAVKNRDDHTDDDNNDDDYDGGDDDYQEYDYIDKRSATAEYYGDETESATPATGVDNSKYKTLEESSPGYMYQMGNLALSAAASTGGAFAVGTAMTLLAPFSLPVQLAVLGSTLGVTSFLSNHLTDITDALYLTTPQQSIPSLEDTVDLIQTPSQTTAQQTTEQTTTQQTTTQQTTITTPDQIQSPSPQPTHHQPQPQPQQHMKPSLPPEDEFATLINRRKQQESLSALPFDHHTSTSIRSRYAPPPQHQPEIFPLNEESYYAKPNYSATQTTTTTTTDEFSKGMNRNAGLENRLEASLSRARARQEDLTMQLRTQELSEREKELRVLQKINNNAFDLSDNIVAEPKSPVEKQSLREEKRKLYDVARNLDYSSRDAQSQGLFGATGGAPSSSPQSIPTTTAAPTPHSQQSNNMASTSSRIGRRQQPTIDEVFG